jgi:diguanylate cyclase (GGDEF)-like protein
MLSPQTCVVESDTELQKQLVLLDRRVFDLQALLKAGQALHSELEINNICRLIMAMVVERTGCEQIAVLVMGGGREELELRASEGFEEPVEGQRFPVADGLFWRLVTAGEPFAVRDREGAPRFTASFERYQLSRLNAWLWVPMVVNGQVVGVISLGPSAQPGGYSSDDYYFLWALGAQAAVSLSTASLYQEMQAARAELDRSLHNLSMLFDVTRALGAISDLTRLLRLILNRAIAAVNAEKGSLMLLDESTGELVVRVVFGLPDKEVERQINHGERECKSFARGEGVAGRVLATGKAALIDQVHSGNFAQAETSHVQSIMCVPLKVDDEVIGVINITNRKDERPFGSEDEHIMEALANQAAVAIARTRLYEAAITDGLTGLFVRRFVVHRLYEEFRRARRYGTRFSVVMCDIDHFKSVNDTYGHAAGDAVIVSVALALRENLRQDVDVIGRYGGEEFLLLLPQTGLAGGVRAAERMRQAVDDLRVDIARDEPLAVTMSFGVAEVDPKRDVSEDHAMRRADEALYASKRQGRNRVSVSLSAQDTILPLEQALELLAQEEELSAMPPAEEAVPSIH